MTIESKGDLEGMQRVGRLVARTIARMRDAVAMVIAVEPMLTPVATHVVEPTAGLCARRTARSRCITRTRS